MPREFAIGASPPQSLSRTTSRWLGFGRRHTAWIVVLAIFAGPSLVMSMIVLSGLSQKKLPGH
jgi:hypothetical protein